MTGFTMVHSASKISRISTSRKQPAITALNGGPDHFDDYDVYMSAGSAGELGRQHGLEQMGFWKKLLEHPSYDSWWQQQAMDKILAAQPLKVPVMLVDSLWDQEDIYGAPAVYKAIKPKDTGNDKVFLVLGPWHHGQEIGDGEHARRVELRSDTGAVLPTRTFFGRSWIGI